MSTTLTNFGTLVTAQRSAWPTLTSPKGMADLTFNLDLDTPQTMSQETGLSPQNRYRFSGSNQTSSTRRPQGIAKKGDFIVNSFYFRSSSAYADACKLVITDLDSQSSANVCPVQEVNGEFERIDSHAGGLCIMGDYLYMADSETQTLRVFDLEDFYLKDDNPDASTDEFVDLYNAFLPQVGEIQFSTPSGAKIAWCSVTQDGLNFLMGNFYSTLKTEWALGGKSMVWKVPINHDATEFPNVVVTSNQSVTQYDPKFPAGENINTTLTRIQGALLTTNDELIINRSYSTATQSLIILDDPETPLEFFSGTDMAPNSYDAKNWLYGVEDWAFSDVADRILTTTEFKNKRQIFDWDLSDILGLMA